jgi:C4-dicarboxylate-specific signal transduction histidine kinase
MVQHDFNAETKRSVLRILSDYPLNIVGEMASTIAHELNQPLGAVVNYAQACLRMVTSGNHNNQRLVNALVLTEDQARRAGKTSESSAKISDSNPVRPADGTRA